MQNEKGGVSPRSMLDAGMSAALDQEKAKADRYLANWQRTEEDFARYTRFAEQQKSEAKFANKALMLNLLNALDDLERAFLYVPDEAADSAWVDEIRALYRKFWAALEAHGLTRIDALGKSFDPAVHEAVAQGPGEEGRVVEEVRKGYKLHDRVIRPSFVVVGNGKPA